ncbi:MAG: helicase HerA domain-containing protein [Promethearchaeota archaeon]
MDSKIYRADSSEIQKALGMVTSEDKALEIGEIFGIPGLKATPNVEKLGRVFITGKSGSGKSYTVGVLIEELMKKRIPLVIIDRHGEYSSLKILDEKYIPETETYFTKSDPENSYRRNIIEFANMAFNPQADLDLKYLAAIELKELILPGHCITVNLKGEDIPIQENIVTQLLARIYKASTISAIPPHFIFLDEAHLFAGKKSTDLVETIKMIAQEGRKFGCNLVVITQKPQALDTTIRAQAGTWIIHKLTDVNDIRITTSSAEGLNSRDEDEIQNLMPGEAIITGDITPFCPIQVQIRRRYTVHGGAGINILDLIGDDEELHRSNLIGQFREKYTAEILDDASTEILRGVQLTTTELYNRIDALRLKNLELQEELKRIKGSPSDGLSNSKLKQKASSIASKLTQDIDSVLNELELDSSAVLKSSLPKPEEMYDEKMLDTMGERDDLKIELKQKTEMLDKFKVKMEGLIEKIQTFELETSGIKVENETLKGKLKKEQKRADDAVLLAERAVKAMKSKGKRR